MTLQQLAQFSLKQQPVQVGERGTRRQPFQKAGVVIAKDQVCEMDNLSLGVAAEMHGAACTIGYER